MLLRRSRSLITLVALFALTLPSLADDQIATVYAAILRGEYDVSRKTVDRLLASGQPDPQIARLGKWLDSYSGLLSARSTLYEKTYAWNVQEAQTALSAGKTYLALSFAAQAAEYAPDRAAFAAQPWIADVAAAARESAQRLEQEQHWAKAHAYYTLLWRIYEGDESIKSRRLRAARHARIELIYEDEKSLERRLRNVDDKLVSTAVQLIERHYFEKPDFRKMAVGALDNLIALSETEQLHSFLDGVANPRLRAYFVDKLNEEKDGLNSDERFSYRDLLRLYNRVGIHNQKSVEMPAGLLSVEFLEGALLELDDFTGVVWPADAAEFEKVMLGGFEGVGIQLSLDEFTNRLKVVTPLENSPALRAGVQPDDLIVAVDGESTADWTTDDAVRNIMGPAGSDVVLTLFRPETAEKLDVVLTRAQIRLSAIRGVNRMPGNGWNFILDQDQGIAYVALKSFNPDSHLELQDALAKAREQGMQALILDLRNNPGGLLDVAIQTVATFQGDGEVVSTQGRDEPTQSYELDGSTAPFTDLPLVVLINDGSASASEILAGALQDNHRAVIIGERTFGKGSVQRVMHMGPEARLKLTTSLYYLPSGRSPHRKPDADTWGVDPDLKLELTPKEKRKNFDRQNAAFVIRNTTEVTRLDDETRKQRLAELRTELNDGTNDGPPLLSEDDIAELQKDPCEAPDVDPVLELALLHMRAKLAGDLPWPQQFASNTPAKR